MDRHKRKYYVSDHAIERLRDRWAQMPSHRHRNDPDLGNLIDASVASATSAGRSEALYDAREEAEIRLVDVGEELQDGLFALVRANHPRPRGAPEEAVITIVPATMVAGKKERGEWVLPTMAPARTVATSLGAALAKAKVAPVIVDGAPPPPPTIVPRPEAPPCLITYKDRASCAHSDEEVPEADVQRRLMELLTDPEVRDVRAWREVRFKARMVVELEPDAAK